MRGLAAFEVVKYLWFLRSENILKSVFLVELGSQGGRLRRQGVGTAPLASAQRFRADVLVVLEQFPQL